MRTNPNDCILGEFRWEEHGDRKLKIDNHSLTKREYFAAMAMQGLVDYIPANPGMPKNDVEFIAKASVWCADALIEELNKEVKSENIKCKK